MHAVIQFLMCFENVRTFRIFQSSQWSHSLKCGTHNFNESNQIIQQISFFVKRF
jgi:hypothetical protein